MARAHERTARPRCAAELAPSGGRRGGAHGLIHVVALPGRVAVGQRVVRDVVDRVRIQEGLVNHPRRILHHLVHPPAPPPPGSYGRAARGRKRAPAAHARACPARALAQPPARSRRSAAAPSPRGRGPGLWRHLLPFKHTAARPAQDTPPPRKPPTGAGAGAAGRAGRRGRPALAVPQRLVALLLRHNRLPLVLVRELVAAAADQQVRVWEPAQPESRRRGCAASRRSCLQQRRVAHWRGPRTASWPAPMRARAQSGKDQRCLRPAARRISFQHPFFRHSTGRTAHRSLGRTICIHAHGARAFWCCTARLCDATGGPWFRCYSLCFRSRLPLGHRVHVGEPHCRTESCTSMSSTQCSPCSLHAACNQRPAARVSPKSFARKWSVAGCRTGLMGST